MEIIRILNANIEKFRVAAYKTVHNVISKIRFYYVNKKLKIRTLYMDIRTFLDLNIEMLKVFSPIKI